MTDEYKKWKEVHQPFELSYHQHGNFRWPGRENIWDEQWNNIFSLFGKQKKDQFTDNQVLIDIGCGSRPALSWFEKGKQYNIDPLLEDYLKIEKLQQYWEPFTKDQLISAPAEELQTQLINKADFILCWNVLDHTYDWKKILNNCFEYLNSDGVFLLGTDHGGKEHIGHPGIQKSEELFKELDSKFKTIDYSKAGFKRCRIGAWLLAKKTNE